MSPKIGQLKTLFTSEARVRVIARLVLHTGAHFYQAQVAELEKLPLKGVQREFEKLLRFGLLKRDGRSGRRHFYQANPEHPLYPEIKAMVLKTMILGTRPEPLKKPPFTKIRVAFVFGSIAKADEDRRSDIDILVVGSISSIEWQKVTKGLSSRADLREENSIVMSENEFRKRIVEGEDFLKGVVSGPKIFLIGGQDELERLVENAKSTATHADA